MKILLLFPPPGNAHQPYTSLPALTAFMRREGYEVIQRDVSIEAVEDLLTRDRLVEARKRVLNRLEALEQQAETLQNSDERVTLRCVAVGAEYVCQHIDQAKETLRHPQNFFDFDQFSRALNLVNRGRELLSAEYYPSTWRPAGGSMPSYDWSVSDLLAATKDQEQNIFLAYFRDILVPSVQIERPDLIGISITYAGQIIPGLTLARLLKLHCPTAHICLGGAILASMHRELRQNPSVFAVADSIVVGEGEHALLGLARALENGSDLSAVPNLLYLNHDQVQATPFHTEDVNGLPTPDYCGLPMELYLTPQITALLPTERGCYWRRCAFCTISTGMRKYRPRKLELVLHDMERLSQQLHTRCFFLSNDAMPPRRMLALAEAISTAGLDFTWQTEARLETSLTPKNCQKLAAGGCRRLLLGLESGSQRVLDLMEKGITVDQAARVLHNCHDAGIFTHVFFIVGFPTETRQEAQETLTFIQDHHKVISSLNYVPFDLNCGSKVYVNPEHYGIEEMELPPADWLNGNVYEYKVSRGLTPDEVSEEMLPEGLRFLNPFFEREKFTLHASWALLNYLAHHRVNRLEELPITFNGYLSDERLISELVPAPANGLFHSRLNDESIVVFNPTDGNASIMPAEAGILLSLCGGQETIRQLSNRLASMYEGAGFIRAYFQGLQLIKLLIKDGFMTVA